MLKYLCYILASATLTAFVGLPCHAQVQSTQGPAVVAATPSVISMPHAELVWLKDSIVSDVLTKTGPKAEKVWNDPTVLVSAGAVLLAIASLTFSFYQFKRNRADTMEWKERDSRANRQAKLLDSLKWFEGGIQTRAVGIAVIEGHWREQSELRSTWASVLVSQAVYIISKPEAELPQHEARNLERILALLRLAAVDTSSVHRDLGKKFMNPIVDALSDFSTKNTKTKEGKTLTPSERKDFISQVFSAVEPYRDLFQMSSPAGKEN